MHGSLASCMLTRQVGSLPLAKNAKHSSSTVIGERERANLVVRLATYIIIYAWDIPNLRVKLQPSLFSHSVFTDVIFFFHGHENQIKKSDIYTNLSLQTKATAQTLREAHILLMEKGMDTVVFGLTNSIVWSFAKATKYGVQLKVDQYVNLDVEQDHEKILKMLEYVMQGKWPQY